jgi:hypothetical protein
MAHPHRRRDHVLVLPPVTCKRETLTMSFLDTLDQTPILIFEGSQPFDESGNEFRDNDWVTSVEYVLQACQDTYRYSMFLCWSKEVFDLVNYVLDGRGEREFVREKNFITPKGGYVTFHRGEEQTLTVICPSDTHNQEHRLDVCGVGVLWEGILGV